MENLLSIPDSILYGSLRPWTPSNECEDKFKHLLNLHLRAVKHNIADFFKHAITTFKSLQISIEHKNVKEFETLSQTIPDLEFEKKFQIIQLPVYFNKKTEFYSILMRNELIGALSITCEQLKHADEIEINYKLYHLFGKIEALLDRISELTLNGKVNLFILDTLKLCLLNIHVELVRLFSAYLDFEVLSEGELLYLVSPDYEYEKAEKTSISFLIDQFLTESKARVKIEEQVIPVKSVPNKAHLIEKAVFTPRQSDFRGEGKSPVSYADIRDVPAFSKLEIELFDSGIMNEEYEFQAKRGHKEMLAAIYMILIQKNYFRKRNFKRGCDFEEFHYRQYLDVRYQVDTSQQFRKCTQESIEKFKFNHSWIDHIAYCR